MLGIPFRNSQGGQVTIEARRLPRRDAPARWWSNDPDVSEKSEGEHPMSSRRISRRSVLRGAGAALALPWLETMAPGAPAETADRLSEPPLRMVFMYMPNGVRPDYWTPKGDGEDYEITPHLKPLESLKSDFMLLENLWNAKTVGRNGHWPKVPGWLSGGYVERTSGDDLDSGGTTVDQFAAQRIGDRTMLPSFELGLEATRTGIDTAGGGFARMYGSFISWRDPHTPVPKEIVPQLAFDRLFRSNKAPVLSSVNPDDPSLLTSLQRDETSVLDLVREQAGRLRKIGSSTDRVRLDEYFESVRSVEQRMQAALKPQKRWINQGKFPLERPGPGHPGVAPRAYPADDGHHDPGAMERLHPHRRVHDGRRPDQRGFFVYRRRQRRDALAVPPRRGARPQNAVREVRHLARGAGRVLPEAPQEPGRRRHVAARQLDGDVRLRHQVRQSASRARSSDRAGRPRQRAR